VQPYEFALNGRLQGSSPMISIVIVCISSSSSRTTTTTTATTTTTTYTSCTSCITYRSASWHVDACSKRLRREHDFQEVTLEKLFYKALLSSYAY